MKPGSRSGVFRIGVIAEKYGIHPQTLRMYEREGLLRPARTEGILHMKQRMERMHGDVQKMLEVMRTELDSRRRPGGEGTLALAKIPGRRYASGRSDRG